MERELKVQYGLNCEGRLIPGASVSPGEHYSCPGCGAALLVRAGDVRVKHLAHRPSAECHPETVEHRTAKLLLAQAINDNAEGVGPIQLDTSCQICGKTHTTSIQPKTFTRAAVEWKQGRFVCDVAALGVDGEVRLALEVRQSHAVPEEKASELGCRWLELGANAVLEQPLHWRPLRANLKPTKCTQCRQMETRLLELARNAGIREGTFALAYTEGFTGYVIAEVACYRCKKPTPAFWWQGTPFCEEPPPTPRPRTVQLRYSSSFGGKYWVNTCCHCNAIQGDNFVFLGLNGERNPLQQLPKSSTNMRAKPNSDSIRSVVEQLSGLSSLRRL